MAAQNDREYYAKRAREERLIAEQSPDASIALAHLRMADLYERRAEQQNCVAQPMQLR